MFVARSIPADHKDLIHDVAFDFHGRRMATCSSDQNVKVWDLGEDGHWTCTANWKTHSGSVWKVTWAHPEFGQVIATCSFDRTAAVWEELVGESTEHGQKNWVKRTSLVDSRTSVTDVQFAPKHLGLQLATCSADGIVRIYEAPDVMNLSQWSLQHEISCKLSCSCISWNPSRVHQPMIAVGSDDANPSGGGKVQIYEYNDNSRKWSKVETITVVTESVKDIQFAPNLGRSYHLLGIASKDVRIISLKPLRRDQSSTQTSGHSKFDLRQVAQFDEHNAQVWRLSWNVTGTVLASSGDDGCVRLWKANYLDNWKCISVLKGDGSNVKLQESSQVQQQQQTLSGGAMNGTSSPPGQAPLPLNIKRNSGWAYFNTKKDQGKHYY
ncbi:nucleoporin SEH1 isoform X1 [Lingula anatina]|uniref:Nucleoporin SEH1 isoform X1 n=2 Tax=Lingula anatina TaxID=7574 RepID=A0A1S3IF33_LINAN|nr:nucleoporin SEH1 isoform X1 [Lingula anatina]|eukprot:XP_013396753.1 nucleoporin SEH1 isoform X1 [Lingula anatina]